MGDFLPAMALAVSAPAPWPAWSRVLSVFVHFVAVASIIGGTVTYVEVVRPVLRVKDAGIDAADVVVLRRRSATVLASSGLALLVGRLCPTRRPGGRYGPCRSPRVPALPEVSQTVWVAASDAPQDPTRWIIHSERLVDETRRLRLSIAEVELPDGMLFEQYVLRIPKAVMTVLLDDAAERVLMIWRHRFVPDSWTWELPGGYLDPGEDPLVTAMREVQEETGWRPHSMTLLTRFQPLAGTADFENLIFLGQGADDTGEPADINEAARTEWITLDSIPDRIARNEIIGAGTQIGLLYVLAFHRCGRAH